MANLVPRQVHVGPSGIAPGSSADDEAVFLYSLDGSVKGPVIMWPSDL